MSKYSQEHQLEYFYERIAGNLKIVAWQKVDPAYKITITSLTEDTELMSECKQPPTPVYESIGQWYARTKAIKKPRRKFR